MYKYIRPATSFLSKLHPIRKMSSASAPPKIEWLCILPDQEGARERRLATRPRHFEGIGALVNSGFLTMGGALLNEPPKDGNPQNFDFSGSVVVATGETKEEVIEKLKQDPYTTENVWDWEKAQIIPFLCAVRQAK
ncbi:hypothetical protein BZA77DRAFT_346363 [Pyronema omphalodes]|nr:hypothetical protein BZA77DRAFT_346363 [Pyronema omphalodes]